MVSADELERVLRDFNFTYGTEVAAILTKTGAPIALQANAEVAPEHFATMAATLVGSMDVMYRGVGLDPPTDVVVDTGNGLLTFLKVGRDVFFVALGREGCELATQRDEAMEKLKRVLEPLKPLEKFAY